MRWVDRECSCLNCCIDKLESALTHLKNSRFDSEFNRLDNYDQNTKAADFLSRHIRKLIKDMRWVTISEIYSEGNSYFKEVFLKSDTSENKWKDQYLGEWAMTAPKKPRVVCLCGSTRFYEEFQKANFIETMNGNIVLTIGFYPHAQFSKKAHGEDVGITREQKAFLDELHKRKIDLADEILVLNVGGYCGVSTTSEVYYAKTTGKLIRWLEPDKAFQQS